VSNQTWNARHNAKKLSARPRSTCEAKNQIFESPDYHPPPPTPRITCNTPLGRNSKDERRRARVSCRHTKKGSKRAKEDRSHPSRTHTRRTSEVKEGTRSRSQQRERLGKQPCKVTQPPHDAPSLASQMLHYALHACDESSPTFCCSMFDSQTTPSGTPSTRTEQHTNPLLPTPIKIGEKPIPSTMSDLCYELEAASPPGWTVETIVVDEKEHDRWTDSMSIDGPKVYDHCIHFEPRHACHTAAPDLYTDCNG